MEFPWEAAAADFPWEAPECDSGEEAEEVAQEQCDYTDISQEEAGDELFELLIDLKSRGKISAVDACLISFWCKAAGGVGKFSGLARRPGLSTGNYSKHYDSQMGGKPRDAQNWYDLKLASHPRATGHRIMAKVPALPPHEVLAEELLHSDARARELREAALPQEYLQHPVVTSSCVPVYPIALYVDAVPFTRTNSCLQFSVYCMTSGRRHRFFVWRKTDFCKCGCKGWCTLYGIWSFVAWSLQALVEGRFPRRRHDGCEFATEGADAQRACYAGDEMGFKCILLAIKGDWSEYLHTYAFPSWGHAEHPCFLCKAPKCSWGGWSGLSPVTTPFQLKTAADYEAACCACEVVVSLSRPQFLLVKKHLRFDKSPRGGGRLLTCDIPGTVLLQGDRLEPNPMLPDVFAFEELLPRACQMLRVLFWRSSQQRMTKHRNPLFSAALHISPQTIAPDWLHVCSLGVFGDFSMHLVHACFESNVWAINAAGGGEVRRKLSTSMMEIELFQWYRAESEEGREHTHVQRLDATFFGKPTKKKWSLYGAETNGFLCFLLSSFAAIVHDCFALTSGSAVRKL